MKIKIFQNKFSSNFLNFPYDLWIISLVIFEQTEWFKRIELYELGL